MQILLEDQKDTDIPDGDSTAKYTDVEKDRILQEEFERAAIKAKRENARLVRGPDGKPMVLPENDIIIVVKDPPQPIGTGQEIKYPKHEFLRTNKKGDTVPDAIKIAMRISQKYTVLAFAGILFVYVRELGTFREDRGEVDHEIQALLDHMEWTGSTLTLRKEVKAYLLSSRVYSVYPFDSRPYLVPFTKVCAQYSPEKKIWESVEIERDHLFRYRIPVDLNIDADVRPVDELFTEWVEPEDVSVLYQAPAQAILQAMIRQPYKRSYLFMGKRNSGKSSYFELLTRAFGSENLAKVPLQKLSSQFALAPLEGKLMNVYDDLSNFQMSDVGTFKTLTGACEFQIERKHQMPYNGRITAVHMFSCNEPPKIAPESIDDEAFWGRWEYVIFPNSFRTEPTFYDRVYTEQFLQAFIAGVMREALKILQIHCLPHSSEAWAVRDCWVYATDPIFRFVKEEFRQEIGAFLSTEDIYQRYRNWCERCNVSPADRNWLTRSLLKFGFTKRQIKKVHGYAGFNFKEAFAQHTDTGQMVFSGENL